MKRILLLLMVVAIVPFSTGCLDFTENSSSDRRDGDVTSVIAASETETTSRFSPSAPISRTSGTRIWWLIRYAARRSFLNFFGRLLLIYRLPHWDG